LSIGAALAIAVLLGGAISGGAFNPAIAVCLFLAKKITKNELLPYIVSETFGAICGLYLAKLIGFL
jgi:glycerol uptake facilitator-like aquaporin